MAGDVKSREELGQICVAVDLTAVKRGGENGGLKIAVLNFLVGLRRRGEFRFVLIGSAPGRFDLLPLLAAGDLYLETPFPVLGALVKLWDFTGTKSTSRWSPGFLQRLGVQVLYSPFSTIHYSEQGLPFMTWIADLLHRDCPVTLNKWQIRAREDGLMIAVRESTLIQVNSEFIAERIRSEYGVPPDRLVVLPPVPQYLPYPDHPRDPDKEYFFYPANFWAHKNHQALLNAYQTYLSEVGKGAWDLVLTGAPGPDQEKMKVLAGDLGILDRVRFLGYLDREAYLQWFAAAGCLMFPSLYEGFGMPLVEAMRLRVPIVAANRASIPEVCGEAFYPVDPEQITEMARAMRTVSREKSIRRKLVAAGEERLKTFDESDLVERLADILRRLAHVRVTTQMPRRSTKTNLLRVALLAGRVMSSAVKS
jgi:glycosyltransferase involved in cell wall biosynthesis